MSTGTRANCSNQYFATMPGVIAGAAGDDRDAVDRRDVEIDLRQRHLLLDRAQVAAQRLRDHGRLLEDLLLHEVAVVALLDRRGRGARSGDLALDRIVVLVEDLRALAGDDDPVAFVEIGDLLGQRGERQRVGPEIGLALAVTRPPAASRAARRSACRDAARKAIASAKAPRSRGSTALTASSGEAPALDLLG